MSPRPKNGSQSHDLDLARRHALDLAKTLMVCVILFEGDLGYGVVPSAEFDGDPASILAESFN